MSSVSSVASTGVADLLQALSSTASSTLSSVLSSSSVQTALKSASPGDLVQLSQQAVESQVAAGLFSSSDTSQTSTDPGTLLLQAVNSSVSGSTSSGSTSSGSSTSLQQVEQLFGTNSTAAQSNGLSFLG